MEKDCDPISTLMEEHQIFLRRLEQVRADLQRLPDRAEDRLRVATSMAAFAEFLGKGVDGFHGRKEEEGLFPVLARHVGNEGGPVGVMLEEHETLRGHQRIIAGRVADLENDSAATKAWAAVSSASDAVDQLLVFHIDKEDHVLFPMARAILSQAEMSEVAQVCQELEERLGNPLKVAAPYRNPG